MKKRKVRKDTKKYLKKLERRQVRKAFKEWSLAVKERDGNKCVICSRTEYAHAHHIIPREIKETRFNVMNGITLCAKHHKYSVQLSAHKNPLAFALWLEVNRPAQYLYVTLLLLNHEAKETKEVPGVQLNETKRQ